MYDKSAVRRDTLSRRRALPAPARDIADLTLVARAVDLVRGLKLISAYLPMPGEPGGVDLVVALSQVVPEVLVPVLLPDLDLDWVRFDAGAGVINSGRLREPVGPRRGRAAVAGVEIALVPAVAVDRTGNRLGRGGGSYDRALARVPRSTPVVALLYDGEICDVLPADAHDRPVSGVLTPTGLRPSDGWDAGAVGNTEWTNGRR